MKKLVLIGVLAVLGFSGTVVENCKYFRTANINSDESITYSFNKKFENYKYFLYLNTKTRKITDNDGRVCSIVDKTKNLLKLNCTDLKTGKSIYLNFIPQGKVQGTSGVFIVRELFNRNIVIFKCEEKLEKNQKRSMK